MSAACNMTEKNSIINKLSKKLFWRRTQMGRGLVITIDGPAGAGKSTVAKKVAAGLGVSYLDSGAIYRAITWYMLRAGIPAEESGALEAALGSLLLEITKNGISVNGRDVSKEIRTPEIDKNVSPYSALKIVRNSILDIQRAQGKNGIVADGRDMGTVVYPDADLKIFLTAGAEERAKRRYEERIAKGEPADYEQILEQVKARDEYDMNRETAPLRPAENCVVIDSTQMNADEVASAIAQLARSLR